MNGIARHWCLPSRTRTSFRSLGSIGSKWTLVAQGVDVATDQRRRDSRAENISARFQRPLLARWLTRWFQKKILFPSMPITSRRQGFLLSFPAAHPFSLSLTLRSSSTRLSSARLTTVMRSQGNLPGVCYLGRKFDTIGARHKTDFRIGWSHCRRTGHFYRGKGAGTQQLVPRRRPRLQKPPAMAKLRWCSVPRQVMQGLKILPDFFRLPVVGSQSQTEVGPLHDQTCDARFRQVV